MPRISIIVAALGVAGATAVSAMAAAAPATAAPRAAAPAMACSTHWGTNAKHRGSSTITVATRVRGVRAGKHGCFDRLVIDLSGGKRPPFSARYVKHIVADASGKVLKVRGHAKILIVGARTGGPPLPRQRREPGGRVGIQELPPGERGGLVRASDLDRPRRAR